MEKDDQRQGVFVDAEELGANCDVTAARHGKELGQPLQSAQYSSGQRVDPMGQAGEP